MSEHKLDIFKTLKAIDRREHDFLDNLTPEERSGFVAAVVLRWAYNVEGPDAGPAAFLMNEYANRNFYDVADHPDLQFRLMCAAGLGSRQRHVYAKPVARRKSHSALRSFLSEHWPRSNAQERAILISQFETKSFKEFLRDNAVDDKLAKILLAEFKDAKAQADAK